MKKIKLSEGREIETPWLNLSEAAIYCGVGRTYLVQHANEIKSSGSGKARKFKAADLDEWMKERK